MPAIRKFTTIALAAALALGTAACATPASDVAGTEEEEQTATPGGVLRVGENADEPPLLDPHQLSTTNTTTLLRPIFDTLVWQNADGTFTGDLAKSWAVSDDGLEYTFTLRDDVTFHDGSPWNAEGLKANFEHILAPETKSPLAASYIAPYESSEVIDEYTLKVRLSTPYSSFINVLAQTYLSIVSPKQIAEAPETIAEHPIGSGPFKFVKWVKGESIELERNEDYAWAPEEAKNQGVAYLDGITFSFVSEDAVRYNGVVAGDFDVIEWTPPQQVEQAKENPDLGFDSTLRPGHPFSIWLNNARAPFDDVSIRQAFVAAIDRKQIVDTVSFGQWEVANGYITPVTPDYSENATAIDFDPDRANDLLDEAGWTDRDSDGYRTKDGSRLTAVVPNAGTLAQTTQILELVQAQAKEVGIDVQIELVSAQESSDRAASGDYDLSAGIWTTNTADVLWIRYSSDNITTPERRGQNGSYTSDAELDALLDRARQTTNDDERSTLYADAQAKLVELAPAVPLYVRPDLVTYRKAVKGVTFESAYGALWFQDTWLTQE
jgi:peptide/nickel transport system substrate-binding protein